MPASTREELFVVDPAEFVAARDALARELRGRGDKQAAAAVRALRRPAIPVWALNRVADTDAAAVGELLDAEDEARLAQESVFAGADRSELRAALARRRAALHAVLRAAGDVVAASGRPAANHQRAIESTLNAVLASDEWRAQLRRAQLVGVDTDEPDGDGDDLTAVLGGSPAAAASPAAQAKAQPATVPARTRAKGDELAARRRASARADLRGREAEASDATARAEHAQQAAAEADADLEAALEALARAEEAARAARRSATDAERARAKAASALEHARQEVESLDPRR